MDFQFSLDTVLMETIPIFKPSDWKVNEHCLSALKIVLNKKRA